MAHRHENENQAKEAQPAETNPQTQKSIELVHNLVDNSRDIVAKRVSARENLG